MSLGCSTLELKEENLVDKIGHNSVEHYITLTAYLAYFSLYNSYVSVIATTAMYQ